MKRIFRHRIRAAFAIFVFGSILCLSPGISGAATEKTSEPVRLLFITLDTLRADRLGFYGYERATSPILDELASTSTVFLDVTCSLPTTLPSHYTIFTGLTPAQHGISENGRRASQDVVSIFELLAEHRGAASAAIVSTKVLGAPFLDVLGFGEVRYGDGAAAKRFQVPGEQVTEQAQHWLDVHGEGSFALWLHYYDTHEPYSPEPRFAERFAGDYEGPLPDRLETDYLISLNQPEVLAKLSKRDRRHVADLYDAEVAELDEELGRLFAWLKKRGLYESTTIVVVADHGQSLGEQEFWGHGEKLLESIVKVPMLVRLAGQNEGRRIGAKVETLDLVPTLAEHYGVPLPPACGGRSLLSAWDDPALQDVELRFVERRTYAKSAPERRGVAVYGDDWKLTFYREEDAILRRLGRSDGDGGLDGEDFFGSDRREVSVLRKYLERYPQPPGADQEADSPLPEVEEMLKALGYVQ